CKIFSSSSYLTLNGVLGDELGGGFFHDTSENPIEMHRGIEATLVSRFRNTLYPFVNKKLTGLLNTYFIQKGDKRLHAMFFKEFTESCRCHVDTARHLLHRNIAFKIIDGVLDYRVYTLSVGVMELYFMQSGIEGDQLLFTVAEVIKYL